MFGLHSNADLDDYYIRKTPSTKNSQQKESKAEKKNTYANTNNTRIYTNGPKEIETSIIYGPAAAKMDIRTYANSTDLD